MTLGDVFSSYLVIFVLFAKQTLRKNTELSLSVSVCLSLASDSSETIKVIIKFGTMAA